MSSRKKTKSKSSKRLKRSIYLNPDMEAINSMAIKVPEKVKNRPAPTGGHVYNGSGGGDWWNKGGSSTSYVACNHDGSKLVIERDGKKLFGSAANYLDEFSGNWDLIIDLARAVRWPVTPTEFVMGKSADRFKDLQQHTIKYTYQTPKSEVLQLDWPDMKTPPVTINFWYELWDRLPATTVICCVGSHGRTGSCMTALLIASGMSFYDALDLVRKNHCSKAVETLDQEKYLHKIYIDALKDRIAEGENLNAELEYALANVPNTPGRKDFGQTSPIKDTKPSTSDVKLPLGDKQLYKRYRIHPDGSIDVEECTEKYCWEVYCHKKNHLEWLTFDVERETVS